MKKHKCSFCIMLTVLSIIIWMIPIATYGFGNPINVNNFRAGEFLLDSTIVYVSDSGTQFEPNLAFDGVNYMMVWWVGKYYDYLPSDQDLYIARINQSGEILDRTGIFLYHKIFHEPWGTEYPANIAFNGTNYLVVYGDDRIYGKRIAIDGTVLDPTGINITNLGGRMPSAASDGSNYFVVWCNDSNIVGTRVTSDGVVLDTAGIPISTANGWQLYPSICFAGTQYFVVWTDQRNNYDIYGSRISTDGTVLDSTGIYITRDTTGFYPFIASDGTNCLAIWTAPLNVPQRTGIFGVRISSSGAVIDTNAIAISHTTNMYYSRQNKIAFDGSNYFVLWGKEDSNLSYSICGVRVSPTGVVLDTADVIIRPYHSFYPSISFDGIDYLIGWVQPGGIHGPLSWEQDLGDIYYARMTQSGMLIDTAGLILSDEGNIQKMPKAAFDGMNYLACWMEYHRVDFNDIYATRISGVGGLLDSNSIVLTSGVDSIWWVRKGYPVVAFGDNYYLASWSDYTFDGHSDQELTRVTTGGIVVDTNGYFLYDAGLDSRMSSAFDGQNFLLVWDDGNCIYGNRVTGDGVIIDTIPFIINSASGNQARPDISFDGINYLVIWEDTRNGNYDIYGSLVTPQGVVLNPGGIPISCVALNQQNCTVAFDGTNYLAVWDDYRSGSGRDIYACRLTVQGQVLDSSGICIVGGLSDQTAPDVAFDGENYLVAWRDSSAADLGDIYCARVSPGGSVIGNYPITTMPGLQIEPSLARGSNGRILILWSGYLDSLDHKPVKAMRIWCKMYPFTGIDETTNATLPHVEPTLRIVPNPTRGKTTLYAFSGNEPAIKSLNIYDNLGRCVKSFQIQGGSKVVSWDGCDDLGRETPQGVYFCQLDDGVTSIIQKIIRLK